MSDWRKKIQESPLFSERLSKADEIRESGGNPYANDFKVSHTAEVIFSHGVEGEEVSVAGRVRFIRRMGKVMFMKIADRTCLPGVFDIYKNPGEDHLLQVMISADTCANFDAVKSYDLGDIVGVKGTLMRTKTGELTVRAESVRMLTKSIRPMPAKFNGVSDAETCYRQRYVDLMSNEDTVKVFQARADIISTLRGHLDSRFFLEVETPMLHPVLGGANARPFTTHHNALDMDLYLRIAPELYLKRLLVGGLERVYEINRNFRNEGLSRQHNPEFTMLEFYQAYATCEDLMGELEGMVISCAAYAYLNGYIPSPGEGNHGVKRWESGDYYISVDGEEICLSGPWNRLSIPDAISAIVSGDIWDPEVLRTYADAHGIHVAGDAGEMMYGIFEYHYEKTLIQPTFVVDFPASVSPLARRKDSDPRLVDRFELYIGGRELANGFSELNDPEDQYGRFADQLAAKEAGSEETMQMDDDYIRALEYGMPPAAGCGIGIDRLTMLITGSPSIRDVILFPLMRAENG